MLLNIIILQKVAYLIMLLYRSILFLFTVINLHVGIIVILLCGIITTILIYRSIIIILPGIII